MTSNQAIFYQYKYFDWTKTSFDRAKIPVAGHLTDAHSVVILSPEVHLRSEYAREKIRLV